ncbi:MAG: type I-C CRISPR-associated protein Cas7/Csd2 [Sumerlaeia bacterium]
MTATVAETTGVVTKRHDFLYLFDVKDGNPNGDPDAGNMPRLDPETNQGLVSDVSLKRKIRDFVQRRHANEPPHVIYVQHGHSLYSQQAKAYDALKLKAKEDSKDKIADARNWMCENFFDIRAFGAVMSVKEFNCGQVRGPVQVTFARSIHPIFQTEHGITRVAFTKETKQAETAGSTEMGHKYTVPYGLYAARGYVTPHFATDTGFTYADLELLWEALGMMFEIDRSASRGSMAAQRLYVFEHESSLGNAPAQKLFGRIERRINLKDEGKTPRSIDDYNLPKPEDITDLPPSVSLTEKFGE